MIFQIGQEVFRSTWYFYKKHLFKIHWLKI